MANKLQVVNIATREIVEISNGVIRNGVAYYLSKSDPKQKWCDKYHVTVVCKEGAGAYTKYILCPQNGWQFENYGKGGGNKPAPKPAPEKKPDPVPEEKPEEKKDVPTPKAPEEKPTPKAPKEEGNGDLQAAMSILNMLKSMQGPAVDTDTVRQIIREEIGKESKEVVHKIKIADLPEYELPKGSNPELFDTILMMVVNDRTIGRFPWLYGPAGSGKSTIARMIADALGIPFYSVSSLQQKYELEGYSDAVGEFVQTTFYKAMSEGGIFCFDEISTTSGEVQVAFNTAAAQLVYNFPKVGMVKAHPDFHIIACDNSTGRGGDKRYNSRYQLDASTLDRYNFVEVGYSDEHDLNMANGDKNLVKFIKDVRKALDDANTTYLATPRASKAIKALQAAGMSNEKALWFGLCSGWNKQDIRTIQARMSGFTEWHTAFKNIADKL
jgi:hypothetical protein